MSGRCATDTQAGGIASLHQGFQGIHENGLPGCPGHDLVTAQKTAGKDHINLRRLWSHLMNAQTGKTTGTTFTTTPYIFRSQSASCPSRRSLQGMKQVTPFVTPSPPTGAAELHPAWPALWLQRHTETQQHTTFQRGQTKPGQLSREASIRHSVCLASHVYALLTSQPYPARIAPLFLQKI
ncbi:hypothetical protein VTJ83DRAFT_2861 [Remersonia thermophila]|uniref:Uncharacterized protein n=1 Tax=Remersonia thermophila TaxID=72144 RepID=A0ABR4DCJ1_9PEZI